MADGIRWPDHVLSLNALKMWLTEKWNDLVLKFKKKFLGYVEPPPKWASSVAKSPGTRDGNRGSRQGKVLKMDVTDWLSKTGKDIVRTSDDSGSMSAGLSAADRAAIFGLVEVVEKLSEDLKVVSYKVDVLYKTNGSVNSSSVANHHPFGIAETNYGNDTAANVVTEDQDELMDQMKQTERAWCDYFFLAAIHCLCRPFHARDRFKVGPQARYTAQKTIHEVPFVLLTDD